MIESKNDELAPKTSPVSLFPSTPKQTTMRYANLFHTLEISPTGVLREVMVA